MRMIEASVAVGHGQIMPERRATLLWRPREVPSTKDRAATAIDVQPETGPALAAPAKGLSRVTGLRDLRI
jgi:hypothetical protein